eukprot:CAMPEP_0206559442 /NCGR_PEP_ID=MMETSP0325_2-20121206/20396_1 /ASSEMBLY_ACC=CAM_ASM_000347 /TAXON_ID=2866 /ORGANISM="Crypthecodinium cohnii, Strain Seligo" /LENGTH=72 /DNA_ID=CAMNT_0054060943 /DNA_START=797 /DNA_END=1011 /DNA_ORIENTATION=-
MTRRWALALSLGGTPNCNACSSQRNIMLKRADVDVDAAGAGSQPRVFDDCREDAVVHFEEFRVEPPPPARWP